MYNCTRTILEIRVFRYFLRIPKKKKKNFFKTTFSLARIQPYNGDKTYLFHTGPLPPPGVGGQIVRYSPKTASPRETPAHDKIYACRRKPLYPVTVRKIRSETLKYGSKRSRNTILKRFPKPGRTVSGTSSGGGESVMTYVRDDGAAAARVFALRPYNIYPERRDENIARRHGIRAFR